MAGRETEQRTALVSNRCTLRTGGCGVDAVSGCSQLHRAHASIHWAHCVRMLLECGSLLRALRTLSLAYAWQARGLCYSGARCILDRLFGLQTRARSATQDRGAAPHDVPQRQHAEPHSGAATQPPAARTALYDSPHTLVRAQPSLTFVGASFGRALFSRALPDERTPSVLCCCRCALVPAAAPAWPPHPIRLMQRSTRLHYARRILGPLTKATSTPMERTQRSSKRKQTTSC